MREKEIFRSVQPRTEKNCVFSLNFDGMRIGNARVNHSDESRYSWNNRKRKHLTGWAAARNIANLRGFALLLPGRKMGTHYHSSITSPFQVDNAIHRCTAWSRSFH